MSGTISEIIVRPMAGATIRDHCAEIANIASLHDCPVQSVFNEIKLLAMPSHGEQIVAEYQRRLDDRRPHQEQPK